MPQSQSIDEWFMNKMWHGHKWVRINFCSLTNYCTLGNEHLNTFLHRSRFRICKMLFFYATWSLTLSPRSLFFCLCTRCTYNRIALIKKIFWSRLISHEIFHLFKHGVAWDRFVILCGAAAAAVRCVMWMNFLFWFSYSYY